MRKIATKTKTAAPIDVARPAPTPDENPSDLVYKLGDWVKEAQRLNRLGLLSPEVKSIAANIEGQLDALISGMARSMNAASTHKAADIAQIRQAFLRINWTAATTEGADFFPASTSVYLDSDDVDGDGLLVIKANLSFTTKGDDTIIHALCNAYDNTHESTYPELKQLLDNLRPLFPGKELGIGNCRIIDQDELELSVNVYGGLR